MIEVRNLKKQFGTFTAIEDFSCKIEDGSIYGLVGYNGAGKTTLLKTICGIYQTDGGRMLIDGESIFDNEKVKQRIFFVPDELYFLPQASLNRMAAFYRGFYPSWNDKTFQKLTDIFGLDRKARINSFSKGMRRQAEIILAMSSQPEILLLDESFDGLDPQKRNTFKKILIEYIAEKEATVVISSHNLRELEDLCDHIGLINGKKLVFSASLDDMRQNSNKFRVAFDKDVTEDDFKTISCKSLSLSGRVATFVSHSIPDDVKKSLEPLQPVLFETIPMTLEEIFLDEMEVKNYDFSDLF